jgi:hypothetical protein
VEEKEQAKLEAYIAFMRMVFQGSWNEPLNMQNMFSLFSTHIDLFLLKDEIGEDKKISFSPAEIREQLKLTQKAVIELYDELAITEKKTEENQKN